LEDHPPSCGWSIGRACQAGPAALAGRAVWIKADIQQSRCRFTCAEHLGIEVDDALSISEQLDL
jgi:hypothetical protein